MVRPKPRRPPRACGRAARDRAHLDLVLRLPGLAPIAIENKVWSLPEDRQLARYAAGSLQGLDHASLVLLSFTPPG